MAGARDHMRTETMKRRRLQAERNRQAAEAEAKRLRAIGGGVGTEAKMIHVGAPENKMEEVFPVATAPPAAPVEAPEVAEAVEDASLAGVPFASDAAARNAAAAGLNHNAFRGRAFTGVSGFTARDVREIAAIISARVAAASAVFHGTGNPE